MREATYEVVNGAHLKCRGREGVHVRGRMERRGGTEMSVLRSSTRDVSLLMHGYMCARLCVVYGHHKNKAKI